MGLDEIIWGERMNGKEKAEGRRWHSSLIASTLAALEWEQPLRGGVAVILA